MSRRGQSPRHRVGVIEQFAELDPVFALHTAGLVCERSGNRRRSSTISEIFLQVERIERDIIDMATRRASGGRRWPPQQPCL